MSSHSTIARMLAIAFLAGELEIEGLVERGTRLLGKRWRWVRSLSKRVVQRFTGNLRPRLDWLQDFIFRDPSFQRACDKYELDVATFVPWTPGMHSFGVARSWPVPSICSTQELADWLAVSTAELLWFADVRSLESKWNQGRLRHYRYRILAKRFGQIRLVEAPKPRLKEIQRRILSTILDHIPVHSAAHGFVRDRSIVTFAQPHVDRRVVLKIDLHDFFPSILATRITALFRTVGYTEPVADLLAGLCTNTAPQDIWESEMVPAGDRHWRDASWRYARPHLPQGAPTSPTLANLCSYRLDCRLAGLARAAGAQYTRYADDLAFSGGEAFARIVERFQLHICATVMEEGFSVHHRKTRIMRPGVCQQLAGLVINKRVNVRRTEFDRLKATLTNCLRSGVSGQNRDGHPDFRRHLAGRISYFELVNPARGLRLRTLFNQIAW